MDNDKLYELSRLELQSLFNHEFNEKYQEDKYSVRDWQKINNIYKNFNDNLFNSNSPVDLYMNSIKNLESIAVLSNNIRELSREDLMKKFNNDFEINYLPINYTPENWARLTQIKYNFNQNILNTILPFELYENSVNNLASVKIKKAEANFDKTLYDLSSEELQEKLNYEFNEKYKEFHYTEENWLKILEIYRKFNENINVTGFPLRLYSDTRYELSQVETRIKKESTGDKVASKLGDIANSIGKGISTTYKTVKFAFRVLVLNIASVIITIFAHLILGTFIYSILPRFVNDFMLQSIIAGLLFIIFNVMLFLDQDDKDILSDHKINILKHVLTIPFYCCIFLIFIKLNEYPILEELFPVFYPQMWLSAFTEEYVISPMLALAINCGLSVLIYLFLRKKTEL